MHDADLEQFLLLHDSLRAELKRNEAQLAECQRENTKLRDGLAAMIAALHRSTDAVARQVKAVAEITEEESHDAN